MRELVTICLRYRVILAILTVLSLVFGTYVALRAPLDVFPEFVPTSDEIQTEAPGFTAQQVEQLVTKPIEDAVNGSPGLATVRSESIPGLSVIKVQFKDDLNIYSARQGISERLSEIAGQLPLGVQPPKLSPLVSSTMDLLKIGLVSSKVDAYTLRDRADWLLKPRLLAVPGVAHVIVFGGAVRQIQIQADPKRLASYGLSISDIREASSSALALRGAGFMDLSSQRVLLESPTPVPDPSTVGKAVLAVRNNTPVLLRDVATVTEAPALRFGDAVIMGKPGVLLSLSSQYGANTLEVTHAVERVLAEMTPALLAEGITVYPALQRPANFIERALSNLEWALGLAAVLILALLYAFLRDWRSSLITFLAIPLSLLAAIAVLAWRGYTLNTMTLGGLAVAIGVLVDDAIIGIENVLRRLRENAKVQSPRSKFAVMLDASLEVRQPVIYATLVAAVVFLPELLASGFEARFIAPLAVAFILAVIASLVVAVTTTPALAMLLLEVSDTHEDPSWLRNLKAWQGRLIEGVAERTNIYLSLIGGLFLIVAALLPFLGGSLMPDFREGHFVIQTTSAVPGTSLEEMMRVGQKIEAQILRLPFVKTVSQQIGRAELSEDTWGPHRSEFHVELDPSSTVDEEDAQSQLRDIVSKYPGLQTEVVTFLGDRLSESLSGETGDVAIKIYGPDLDALDRVGQAIVNSIGSERGVVDLQFARQSNTPSLAIVLSPDALAANGVRTQDALDTVQAAFSGVTVGQTYIENRIVDSVLLLPDSIRHSPETLPNLMINGAAGQIPLSAVARIAPTESRYSISHDGGQRVVSVTFNVSGRSIGNVLGNVRARIADNVVLPHGTFLEFAGTAAAAQSAQMEFVFYAAIALALIVVLLLACFRWRENVWLALVNLPFSLIGGILAAATSGVGLSLGALVGLVTVFGISARNAILLLAHYEQLVEDEGEKWVPATILRGAQERLTPILMTAAVSALGLLPLALQMNRPGEETEGPMAITVLGGLATSTVLNLILLPALAQRFGRGSSGRTNPS